MGDSGVACFSSRSTHAPVLFERVQLGNATFVHHRAVHSSRYRRRAAAVKTVKLYVRYVVPCLSKKGEKNGNVCDFFFLSPKTASSRVDEICVPPPQPSCTPQSQMGSRPPLNYTPYPKQGIGSVNCLFPLGRSSAYAARVFVSMCVCVRC
jgi:hypothetical protein